MDETESGGGGGELGAWSGTLCYLATYGITKAIDSEFAEPFVPDNTRPLATNSAGQVYQQGGPAFGAVLGAVSPLILIGGVLLLFLLFKD